MSPYACEYAQKYRPSIHTSVSPKEASYFRNMQGFLPREETFWRQPKEAARKLIPCYRVLFGRAKGGGVSVEEGGEKGQDAKWLWAPSPHGCRPLTPSFFPPPKPCLNNKHAVITNIMRKVRSI